MRLSRAFIAFLGISLFAGCQQIIDVAKEDIDKTLYPVTDPVIFLGDTQEHEIAGLPIIATSGYVDRINEVTSRPPQQALFGRMVFKAIANQSSSNESSSPDSPKTLIPVIHLGDLLDNSCESEWNRYDPILRKLGDKFVMAPGNHDGLANGVINPSVDKERLLFGARSWSYECRTTKSDNLDSRDVNGIASKDFFIEKYLYLKNITPHNYVDWQSSISTEDGGFLRNIYAKIKKRDPDCVKNCENYTSSFIVQKITLPKVDDSKYEFSVILLDTTNTSIGFESALDALGEILVSRGNRLIPGFAGYISREQFYQAKRLINTAGENEIIILAGHHPFDALTKDSSEYMNRLYGEIKNPAIYISAHTHTGFWKSHDINDNKKMLELNINSLADWPVAFRKVSFSAAADASVISIKAGLMAGTSKEVSDNELKKTWDDECGRLFNDKKYWDENYNIVTNYRDARIYNRNNGFCPTYNSDWKVYHSKLNELISAKNVLINASIHNKKFSDEFYKNDFFKDVCGESKRFDQCLSKHWSVNCDVNVRGFYSPDDNPSVTYISGRNDHSYRNYGGHSLLVTKAQEVISNIEDPELDRFMACTAVKSAIVDAASDSKFDSTFYFSSARVSDSEVFLNQ